MQHGEVSEGHLATPSPLPDPHGRAAAVDVGLAALLLAVFGPALAAFSAVWDAVDYQAHGYLVGPVAAAMAWSLRDQLGPRRPHALGLGLLLLALLAYAAGLLAGLLALQGVALPLALAGLVLYRRGPRALRTLGFPIAYLIFLVPVPPQWLTPVVTQLQRFVTVTAIGVLRAFDVPVLSEGNVIVVPEGSLFVAEACSGITSIVTLLPVAALLAFLVPGTWRQLGGLLLAVIPVAMFWNLVRVMLTVLATRAVGAERATSGTLHDSAGMLTFLAGCLTLLFLSGRMGPERSPTARP